MVFKPLSGRAIRLSILFTGGRCALNATKHGVEPVRDRGLDGDGDGKPDASEADHNNDLAEASSYVDSVMSQPICTVMRTLIGNRRKHFLSAPTADSTVEKRKDSSPKSSSSKDSEDLSSASGSYYRSDDSSDDDFVLDAEELASESGSKG